MPRANISVSSPATAGSSQRCLSFSLSFLGDRSSLPTCLSLPARLQAAAAGERHSVKVPHQKPAATEAVADARLVLPRSTWSTDNAILGVNQVIARGRSQARVRLSKSSSSMTLSRSIRCRANREIWTSASVCTHRTFRAKCGCLVVIEIECNLFRSMRHFHPIAKIEFYVAKYHLDAIFN